MSERREPGFNLDELSDPVPTLEPEPTQQTPPNTPKPGRYSSSSDHHSQAPASKGRGFALLIAVFALFASAAMGFWNFTLTQKLDEQSVLIEQMNLWLESTDATLSQTSTSASQSGETLSGRLEQINARVDDRVKHFDSEIAKLWTVSYQRNKPLLEEQGKQLDSQRVQLSEVSNRLKTLTETLSKQSDSLSDVTQSTDSMLKTINQLSGQISQAQQQLKDVVDADEQVESSLTSLDQRLTQLASDVEFQLSIERDERAKLADRLQQSSQDASQTLSPRISDIEARLGSIDSSRQSVNSELLKIKQQLNSLMLEGAIR